MAVQRKNSRTGRQKTSGVSQAAVVFWLVFIVVIVSLFIANAQTIKKNFNLFMTRLTSSPGMEQIPLEEETSLEGNREEIIVQVPSRQQPLVEPSSAPVTQTAPAAAEPERPASQAVQQQRPQTETQSVNPPSAETINRNIYYTQIDRDGQILHSRVTRRIPASASPMVDALNIMLIGPTADELNRGIINLIPSNTRILSATVRGSTASINFSEDFLFNTFGIDGYIAQLRQVVWTATEFSTVRDVQILIEGRVLDYMGDGIWIGSPISRQSF